MSPSVDPRADSCDDGACGAGGGDGGAHGTTVNHGPRSPVIAEIVQLWRMRQRWHRAEKSLVLQGKAICRAFAAGDKGRAASLFDLAAAGNTAVDDNLRTALTPFLAAIDGFAPLRRGIELRLRKLVRQLPVYPFVAEIKGFGDLNLAALIGEAGDIGGYRNPSCLWKRMGLAVFDGQRQRRVADADLAVIMGYAPQRRCVSFLLGESLIKAGSKCRYRPLYTDRKAYELARGDDGAPKTQGHAHNRAARYMVKRVLRDLWRAWRAAS